DDDRRTAVRRVRGDAVHDAIGADFLRIVDVNRDAGLHARLDEDRIDVEVLPDHRRDGKIQRRNDRRDDRAFEHGRADELSREDAVFVRRSFARGGQSPRADELFAAVETEDYVRVADIDDE